MGELNRSLKKGRSDRIETPLSLSIPRPRYSCLYLCPCHGSVLFGPPPPLPSRSVHCPSISDSLHPCVPLFFIPYFSRSSSLHLSLPPPPFTHILSLSSRSLANWRSSPSASRTAPFRRAQTRTLRSPARPRRRLPTPGEQRHRRPHRRVAVWEAGHRLSPLRPRLLPPKPRLVSGLSAGRDEAPGRVVFEYPQTPPPPSCPQPPPEPRKRRESGRAGRRRKQGTGDGAGTLFRGARACRGRDEGFHVGASGAVLISSTSANGAGRR